MKKNILITGTSKGIGKYIKDNLSQFNIFEIKGKKDFDLRNYNDIEKLAKSFEKDNIIFDSIILNAGVGEFGFFDEISLSKYEDIINLNLLANIRILKLLKNNINKNTKIIFIGSIISKKSLHGASVYQASKFGLRGLALGLKFEGKKVFLINPKIVDTDFHKGKIDLDKKLPRTKVSDIFNSINNILSGNETKFEIDL